MSFEFLEFVMNLNKILCVANSTKYCYMAIPYANYLNCSLPRIIETNFIKFIFGHLEYLTTYARKIIIILRYGYINKNCKFIQKSRLFTGLDP
jgi:hypothetical protein